MKKTMLFVAAAVLAFGACSKASYQDPSKPEENNETPEEEKTVDPALVGTWTIVGEANGWDATAGVAMTESETNVLTAAEVEVKGEGFKFVKDGSWDVNLGAAAAKATQTFADDVEFDLAQNGDNIAGAKDGVYSVTLNLLTKKAKIKFVKEIEVVDVPAAPKAGELIIEEVYFTGTLIEGAEQGSQDQYIKLTNVADHSLYVDRVMFVRNYINGTITDVGAYYEYPELNDGLAVDDMYVIPGAGTEHLVKPGESVVIAIDALNFAEGDEANPNALDLSGADFEMYDENEYYPDTDNPDVENLDIWFKQSRTITILHHSGLESYAIALIPEGETAESIMTNHHWTGTYYFHFNEYNFDYAIDDDDVWVIPGEWVLDAVNSCSKDSYFRNPWGPAFDAGYATIVDKYNDIARFGKSIRRKVVDGKFADTNNSTNDFEASEPSLKK